MSDPTQPSKTPNHALSAQACPMSLADVDLFADGAQEHWYEAYPILHAECPVVRLEGEGQTEEQDGYILTKYEDIARVVKDPERFPQCLHEAIVQIQAAEEAAIRCLTSTLCRGR